MVCVSYQKFLLIFSYAYWQEALWLPQLWVTPLMGPSPRQAASGWTTPSGFPACSPWCPVSSLPALLSSQTLPPGLRGKELLPCHHSPHCASNMPQRMSLWEVRKPLGQWLHPGEPWVPACIFRLSSFICSEVTAHKLLALWHVRVFQGYFLHHRTVLKIIWDSEYESVPAKVNVIASSSFRTLQIHYVTVTENVMV